jgi:Sensors of blue-light using FAD
MLIQLVYMSAANHQFDSVELTVLLAKARKKNERLGVSGMLVYHDDSFLQVLEGDDKIVQSLYEQILSDGRHANCVMLLKAFIDRRCFGDWTMGFADTKLYGPKTLEGYSDFFGNRFSSRAFESDPSAARKLLLMFRQGEWRQKVENGDTQLVPACG